jgi:hypothetical protein
MEASSKFFSIFVVTIVGPGAFPLGRALKALVKSAKEISALRDVDIS